MVARILLFWYLAASRKTTKYKAAEITVISATRNKLCSILDI